MLYLQKSHIFFIFVVLLLLLASPQAQAAFSKAYIRLDRMKASTATTGTVCAKPATTGIEADVQVTFPTGFTVSTTVGNWTVNTTSLPESATAWPGISTATAASGQVVTFPSTDLTVGTLYCFNWTSTAALTTSTAANDKVATITTRTSAPATIDTSDVATSVVSNDQITVTATVAPTFSFSLSSSTSALGTLSSSSIISGTAINATFSTNGNNGVIGWVKSTNGNLSSTSTGKNITSPGTINATAETLSAGTSGYVLDVDTNTNGTAGTGAVTIDAEYNGTSTSQGGHLDTALQPIFTTSGTHTNGIVNLIVRAAISAVQEAAADYTDTVTVVASARI